MLFFLVILKENQQKNLKIFIHIQKEAMNASLSVEPKVMGHSEAQLSDSLVPSTENILQSKLPNFELSEYVPYIIET